MTAWQTLWRAADQGQRKLSAEGWVELDRAARELRAMDTVDLVDGMSAFLSTLEPRSERRWTWYDARDALRALPKGERRHVNGVPVTRLPCEGEWFRVGLCDGGLDVLEQTLRLTDAAYVVRSGLFERLRDSPQRWQCGACQRQTLRAPLYCLICGYDVCANCQNADNDKHADYRAAQEAAE